MRAPPSVVASGWEAGSESRLTILHASSTLIDSTIYRVPVAHKAKSQDAGLLSRREASWRTHQERFDGEPYGTDAKEQESCCEELSANRWLTRGIQSVPKLNGVKITRS